MWACIINNPNRSRRLNVPQQLEHLRAHLLHFAVWNGQELIFFGAQVTPHKEQAVHVAHKVRSSIVAAAVECRGKED